LDFFLPFLLLLGDSDLFLRDEGYILSCYLLFEESDLLLLLSFHPQFLLLFQVDIISLLFGLHDLLDDLLVLDNINQNSLSLRLHISVYLLLLMERHRTNSHIRSLKQVSILSVHDLAAIKLFSFDIRTGNVMSYLQWNVP
jgi:hypothetical protein